MEKRLEREMVVLGKRQTFPIESFSATKQVGAGDWIEIYDPNPGGMNGGAGSTRCQILSVTDDDAPNLICAHEWEKGNVIVDPRKWKVTGGCRIGYHVSFHVQESEWKELHAEWDGLGKTKDALGRALRHAKYWCESYAVDFVDGADGRRAGYYCIGCSARQTKHALKHDEDCSFVYYAMAVDDELKNYSPNAPWKDHGQWLEKRRAVIVNVAHCLKVHEWRSSGNTCVCCEAVRPKHDAGCNVRDVKVCFDKAGCWRGI